MNFKGSFLFTIVFPDGKRVSLRQYDLPPWGGIYLPGNVSVEPQKTYSQTILLNDWVDLNQVGIYKLEGRLATRIEGVDKRLFDAPSFGLEFNLDVEKVDDLVKTCETYIARLKEVDSSAEAGEIAIALSAFKNPAVVPCITSAINLSKGTGVETILINALRDRGGAVPVDVLIRIMETSPNSTVGRQARDAAEYLERTISDNSLKLKLRKALEKYRAAG
jgi:hypothetical protein